MNRLMNKHILLGICGGIAAYKCCDLIRRLREQGALVKVVMTRGAEEFVSALTFQALSGDLVRQDLFDKQAENAMNHIELARWADCVVIAPASANCLAKINHGLADDLLTTVCLATNAPLLLCPAMNQQMWANQATVDNVNQLQSKGYKMLGPASGSQACGEFGPGRMVESQEIVTELKAMFVEPLLKGKKLLITAGPTREAIDPVRFITNHSSGKMGYALAGAAAQAGALVTLVSGPTAIAKPQSCRIIEVETASQMHQAVMENITNSDIFIASAAVSDYRIKNKSPLKIKKTGEEELLLELVENPDIVAEASKSHPNGYIVGFAAETHDILDNAYKKLMKKRLDMVIANHVGGEVGFNGDENEVTVITKESEIQLPKASKRQIAQQLIDLIIQNSSQRESNEAKDST